MDLQESEVFVLNPWKRWGLYLACLGGILIAIAILFTETIGQLTWIAAFLVACSIGYLLISVVLSGNAHGVQMISSGDTEQKHILLTQTVSRLSKQAGLEAVPKVGIYQSKNMNAFSMGMSRRNSTVAFSSSLLQEMDDKAIEAVAAHEISHIVNGDMVTMCLLHGLVNGLVFLVKIPFAFFKFFFILIAEDKVGYIFAWLVGAVSRVLQVTILLVGNLLAKAFSRRREYKADQGAAYLVDPQSMIRALEALGADTSPIPQEQLEYAAFKINAPHGLIELFSTHATIEKRLSALRKYVQEEYGPEVTNTQENEEDDLEQGQISQIAASADCDEKEDPLV